MSWVHIPNEGCLSEYLLKSNKLLHYKEIGNEWYHYQGTKQEIIAWIRIISCSFMFQILQSTNLYVLFINSKIMFSLSFQGQDFPD
jgi:hypothetical protein